MAIEFGANSGGTPPSVAFTRKGYWRVVDEVDALVSQHMSEAEAFESAANVALAGGTPRILPPWYEVTAVGVKIEGSTGTQPNNYRLQADTEVGVTSDAMFAFSSAPEPEPSGAFYADDFESYTIGAGIDGNGDGSFSWYGSRWVEVSDDIARNGTRSLKFPYGPLEPDGSSHWWSEQRFNFGRNVNELWMEYYLYFPDGTEGFGSAAYSHDNMNGGSHNNKLLSLWGNVYSDEPLAIFQLWQEAGGDSSVDVSRTIGTADEGSLVRYPDSTAADDLFVDVSADLGRWIQCRVHVKVADYGQSNGVFELWKDGVKKVEVLDDPFYDYHNTYNFLRYGYLMGYDNGRFENETYIYIDDFAVYDSDPGWT